MYVVENNIPLPIPNSYVVNEMDTGDSILFETFADALRFRHHLRYRKIKYAIRKVTGGTRVWRLD